MLVLIQLRGGDRRRARIALVGRDDHVRADPEVPVDREVLALNGVSAVLGRGLSGGDGLEVLRHARLQRGPRGEEVELVGDRGRVGLPLARALEGAVVLREAGDGDEILDAGLAVAEVDLGGLRLDRGGPLRHAGLRGLEERGRVVLDEVLVLALSGLVHTGVEEVVALTGGLDCARGLLGARAVEGQIVGADLLRGESGAVVRRSGGSGERTVDVDRHLDGNRSRRPGDVQPRATLGSRGGHGVDEACALGDFHRLGLGGDLRGEGGGYLLGLGDAFGLLLLA